MLIILVDDPASNFVYFNLVDSSFALEAEELVDPVRNTVGAALVGDRDASRTIEQRFRVEDVVDTLVLPQPAGMDARTGNIKVFADQRIITCQIETESSI